MRSLDAWRGMKAALREMNGRAATELRVHLRFEADNFDALDDALADIATLDGKLAGDLADQLGEHITGAEVAALRARVAALLDHPVMPAPDRRRPIPWPAF